MRSPREPALFCFVAALWVGGLACTPDPEISTSRLALTEVQSCALTGVESMTVRALGERVSQSATLDARGGAIGFDDFPLDTREIEVVATLDDDTRATGLARLDAQAGERALWVLPEARSCPLGDPFALALNGAAVSDVSGGGLLIAGGLDSSGLAVSSVLLLAPGAQLVTQVPDGMLLRRSDASATRVGERVVVAGGAADEVGSAHDTYEVFERVLGAFVREDSAKLLTGPRMLHGAAALANGDLLLVGGRASRSSAPLASAELIDADTGKRRALTGASALATARVSPSVLVLDTGEVLVAGGRDAQGKLVTSVERYDVVARRFLPLTAAVPKRDEIALTTLVGGRAAWLACDVSTSLADADLCEVGLLLPSRSANEEPTRVDVPLFWIEKAPRGLSDLRVLGLPNGKLLVSGRDPTAAIARRAFVVDLNHAALESREVTRVPKAVVLMQDGTIAELDAFGTSLRREAQRSVYERPKGNLIDAVLEFVALDAPEHFERTEEALRAVESARFEVAGLRFADVRVTLDVTGAAALLLRGEGFEQAVTLRDGKLQLGKCRTSFPKSSALVVTRRGSKLTAASDEGRASCTLEIEAGSVRLAVQAERDTLVRSLQVSRL